MSAERLDWSGLQGSGPPGMVGAPLACSADLLVDGPYAPQASWETAQACAWVQPAGLEWSHWAAWHEWNTQWSKWSHAEYEHGRAAEPLWFWSEGASEGHFEPNVATWSDWTDGGMTEQNGGAGHSFEHLPRREAPTQRRRSTSDAGWTIYPPALTGKATEMQSDYARIRRSRATASRRRGQ